MYAKFFKRLLDFVVSFIALIVLSPVMLILIVVGAVAMKGNPFFLQPRPGKIGKDGKEKIFRLIKLRTMSNAKDKTKELTRLAIILAIQLILAFTPFIGYIPLGFTRATIVHIPVIIGALILGPRCGAFLGFVFGLTSLYTNTVNPTITSFVFTPFYTLDGATMGNWLSLVICFVPRILVGIVPYYVCKVLKNTKINDKINYAIAGLCGSLTNTLLVMNMIYLFFGESYGAAKNIASDALYSVIGSVILINGVPEAIVAAFLTMVVVVAAKRKNRA